MTDFAHSGIDKASEIFYNVYSVIYYFYRYLREITM